MCHVSGQNLWVMLTPSGTTVPVIVSFHYWLVMIHIQATNFATHFKELYGLSLKAPGYCPSAEGLFTYTPISYKSITLVRGFTHNFTLVPYEEALGGSFIRNHLYQIYGNKEQIFAENVEHH